MKIRCSSFNAGSNKAKFLTLSATAVGSVSSMISSSPGFVGSGGTTDWPPASPPYSDDPPV